LPGLNQNPDQPKGFSGFFVVKCDVPLT
jgi:hypothetical protein